MPKGPTATPEEIVDEVFREGDVRFAISKSTRETVFLVTPDYHKALFQGLEKSKLVGRYSVVSTQDLPETPADGVDYIIFSASEEEEQLQKIRAAWPGARTFGFWNDFYPRAVSFTWDKQKQGESEMKMWYAVVSTPRSGSTFLAELLAANNLGSPKEHVRGPLMNLATGPAGPDRLGRFVETVARLTACEGVAGTKIIWHFALRVKRVVNSLEPVWRILGAVPTKKIVLLFRRDKVAQAVSNYKAQRTSTYHVRGDGALDEYKDKRVEYDFDELMRHYNMMLEGESRLLRDIEQLGSAWPGSKVEVMMVVYEELERDLSKKLGEIVQFLTGKVREVSLEARVQKLSDEQSQEIANQFRLDYLSKFGHAADDDVIPIEAAAVRLDNRIGFSGSSAKGM